MNLRTLVEAFSMDELNELKNLIYEKEREVYSQLVDLYPLTQEEYDLRKEGKIVHAIKKLKDRTGLQGVVKLKIILDQNFQRGHIIPNLKEEN